MLSWLGLVASAVAFAPVDEEPQGIEPNRLFLTHLPAQLALAHQPAWVEFTRGEGKGWAARFDEATGTAHRAWGPGIPMGSGNPAAALRAFFERNREILGVPTSTLRLRSANHVARTGTWYVEFDRLVGGVPIWGGGVTARVRGGELVLLGLDTHPGAAVGQAEIDAGDAILAASLDGAAPLADHAGGEARLVVLPGDDGGRVDYRLVYEVRTRTALPVGRWVSFVDAMSGEVVGFYNEVRFVQGTVYGYHPARTLDGNYATTALPLVYVEGTSSGTSVEAGEDGSFALPDDAAATTYLRGKYLEVRNRAGDEGELPVVGANPTWTEDHATLAEIASYAFVHQVRDWSLGIAPEVRMASEELLSNVNDNSGSCNAYYDGNLNFYAAGGGCNNTGQIADVNYHEWGHGFHYYSLEAGSFDGTISEGAGDIVAALLTGDATVAPYFMTNGAGIRELATDLVYPDDLVNEVHYDGLIFGGAVWDLWENLLDTYGEARGDRGDAWRVTSTLFADALKAGPTLESAYDEFVAADDDDGDLTNGTPHFCEIAEAFGRHGLGPLSGRGAIAVDHVALLNQPARADIEVAGSVVNLAAACVDFTPARVDVVYSTDRGRNWSRAAAELAGSDFSAAIEGLAAGSIVEYYIDVAGTDGTEATWPQGGFIAPFTFYVGELEEIYCEGFDGADDGGYTHELIDGREREGADDWTFDVPGGYADDPAAAYTGRRVWGNDLGGGNYNGEYQPDVTNRLSSVAIDVGTASRVIVQYRRWLNVEDGEYDRARVYANDEIAWENYDSNDPDGWAHTADQEWVLHTLATAVAGSLTLGWEIESDGGLEMGGWNIDDVCVYRPVAAEGGDDSGTTDTAVDPGDDVGQDVDDTDKLDIYSGGCGCDAGGAAGLGALGTLLAAAAGRRRR
ncbi:MAG: M36 family metallopeptidase [Deltaproteobacteria bacterium]|nr:M36 family metallopeptidase [Deltaproteobacteria bacterium]